MRKIFAVAILALAACSCGRQEKDIVLQISVDRPVLDRVGVVLDATSIHTVALDKSGEGTLVLKGCDNIYPTIIYNSAEPVCRAFIRKGQKLTLSIDEQECRMPSKGIWKKGYLFSDPHTQRAAEYLTNIRLAPMPEAFDRDLEGYVQLIDSMAAVARKRLEGRDELESYDDFRRVEKKRIDYAYRSHLLEYPAGRSAALGEPYVADEAFMEQVRKYYVADPELLWCPEYTGYMLAAAELLGDDDFRSISAMEIKKRLKEVAEHSSRH